MNPFKKAKRQDVRLRVLLVGLSGAGKTYSGLAIASHLGGRLAVVDTEDGSASKYADEACQCRTCRGHGTSFEFDVLELDRHSPKDYMQAMKAASANGYGVLLLDSITHEWDGRGGCLEMVDAAQRQAKNKYTAWGPVTSQHQQFLQAIRDWPGHVIATCRAKEKHAVEGKTVSSRGVLPVQREGIEYEFDVVVFLDGARGQIVKTRAAVLDGRIDDRPGQELADALQAWAGSGDRTEPTAAEAPPSDQPPAQQAPRTEQRAERPAEGRGAPASRPPAAPPPQGGRPTSAGEHVKLIRDLAQGLEPSGREKVQGLIQRANGDQHLLTQLEGWVRSKLPKQVDYPQGEPNPPREAPPARAEQPEGSAR